MSEESKLSYVNNLTVNPKLIGFESTLSPYVQNNSAPRMDMWSSHLKQWVVLKGAEFPYIFTGFEHNLGEYEFNRSSRDQQALILCDPIPKYAPTYGMYSIEKNPMYLVIYLGLDDREIHCCYIDSYFRGSDGYGHEMNLMNFHLLQKDAILDKHTKLATSPIHKDDLYCMGVNANVAYMSHESTILDSFVVSQSLADKMTSTAVYRNTFKIFDSVLPINLYGDPENYKFIPDIGECVNDDGILCAFRKITEDTFMADTINDTLLRPQLLHDEVHYAPAGARVLDIDVHMSKNSSISPHVYEQLEKYQLGILKYYRSIVDVYNEYKSVYNISPEFNTLVTNAIKRLIVCGERVEGIYQKYKTQLVTKNNKAMNYVQVDITYAVDRQFAHGFKITDRCGNKGVVGKILPDEDMPVDEFGFRADILIDPAAPIGRMNGGQLVEQALNRISEFVRRQLEATYTPTTVVESFNLLLDYYHDVNPNYAKLIREMKTTEFAMKAHVDDVIKTGIYVNVPPFLNTFQFKNIDDSIIKKLEKKWNVTTTPVSYVIRDEITGEIVNRYKTQENVCIGSKYLVLLCKIPEPSSPGVANVNQYNFPMKMSSGAKSQSPISRTPIRFGEDEHRIIGVDLNGKYIDEHGKERETIQEDIRLMSLQSGSPDGVRVVVENLLTAETPSNIDRFPIDDETLVATNSPISLFRHMFATLGIDVVQTGTDLTIDDVKSYIGADFKLAEEEIGDDEDGDDEETVVPVSEDEDAPKPVSRRKKKVKQEDLTDDGETDDDPNEGSD